MNSPKKYFTAQLLHWHSNVNDRVLPWKEEKDPYKIWLSEIILQQTRAEQGLKYYLNFTETYPTVCDLSRARDEDAFRLWQGLGYYNRCKNMLETARFICSGLGGKFPDRYDDILALKGVGAYTAAAIGSFAFNLPYAVVDGNVYRVLSRYFGIEQPIDSSEGKKAFTALAQELLEVDNPAGYNQAIMDLGATVCTPKLPKCDVCPVSKKCVALQSDLITLLPVKSKKLVVQNRFFNFIVLQYKDKIWIQKRTDKGIWQNLHQFYLIESRVSMDQAEIQETDFFRNFKLSDAVLQPAGQYRQRLTHQLIESKLYRLQAATEPKGLPADGFWVPEHKIKNYAFPKTLVAFLDEEFA